MKYKATAFYWNVGDDFSGGPSEDVKIFKTISAAKKFAEKSVLATEVEILDGEKKIKSLPIKGTGYVPEALEW